MKTLEEVEAAIDEDNRLIHAEFVASIPCLVADEVARIASSRDSDGIAMLSAWRDDNRIFSIDHSGIELFPTFQFRNNVPHPSVARVLKVLGPELSRWNVALWWVAGNGWLEGVAAPADCLDQPAALLKAASRTRERFVG